MFKTLQKQLSDKRFFLIAVMALAVVMGCGYQFAAQGEFPAHINRLFIAILENRTSESGIESRFTNDLISEVRRNASVQVTNRAEAEAVLSGVIHSMRITTIAHQGTHTSLERRVTIAVDLKLTSKDGSVLWAADNVMGEEEYDVAAEKSATEQNRRTALTALSKRMAEEIYARLTETM